MNKRSGITLIEIVFSAMVIGIVLVGVLGIFAHTTQTSKKIDFEYSAVTIAKSRAERAGAIIGTSGFAALENFGESDTLLNPVTGGNFRRSTTVTTPYNAESRCTKIDVEVDYKYLGQWMTDAKTTITTVFTSIH